MTKQNKRPIFVIVIKSLTKQNTNIMKALTQQIDEIRHSLLEAVASNREWGIKKSENVWQELLSLSGDFAVVEFDTKKAADVVVVTINNSQLHATASKHRTGSAWVWRVKFTDSSKIDESTRHYLRHRVSWGQILGFDGSANSNNSVHYTQAVLDFE